MRRQQRWIWIAALVLSGTFEVAWAEQPPPAPLPHDPPPGYRPPPGRPFYPKQPPMFPPLDEQIPDLRSLFEGGSKTPQEIDPKAYKDLLEKLSNKDKPDASDFTEIFKNNPNFQNPEFLKALNKMIQDPDFLSKYGGANPEGSDLFGKNLKEFLDQAHRNQTGPGTDWLNKQFGQDGGLDANKMDLPNTPSGMEGLDPAFLDNEWVKWLNNSFGDSPAAQSAVKDLVKALGNKHPTFGNWAASQNFPKFDTSKFGSSGMGSQLKFRPPKFSLGSGPKSGGSWGGGGGGSSWGGGSSGVSTSGGGGTPLAIIAGLVGAVVLGLLFLKKWKLGQSDAASHSRHGSSTVDFSTVGTREELVKAVDSLTVEKMGDDARQWNHLVVAEQFAESQPSHQEPAHELAGLYERARYSPPQENLSEGEFGDARRDLKLLSGGQA